LAALRRSGGVVVFFWQGKLPDPRDAAFSEALGQRRFRTIENAASEETSVGWVTQVDPTGDSFAPEDLDAGTGSWLRMRVDKKTLPRKWLAIHRDVAEKAKGKKLSARERRELKDEMAEKLLPRVLPTVNLVDVILFHDRKTLMLFATGKSVREQFSKLFFETFAIPLERSDPLSLGHQSSIDRELKASLDRLEPVRWPKQERKERKPAKSIQASTTATEEDA
jgi:hypothetical protein